MKYSQYLSKLVFTIALLYLPIWIQSLTTEMKSFEKDGLTFDYPGGWILVDKSTIQAQHLVLTQEKTSILIMIIAHRELVATEDQFELARRGITEPYIESVAKSLSTAGHPAVQDQPCTEISGRKIQGVRILGLHQNEHSTGEVYSLVKGNRFVNLVYIRADRDGSQGDQAWAVVRKTLGIENLNPGTSSAPASDNIIRAGVLNTKAISLPKPEYSSFARGAHASGTVSVQVTIDEKGHVISAKAITGHPLLQKSSVEAAQRAKFSPALLCGEPVKVSGMITYTFIPGSGLIIP